MPKIEKVTIHYSEKRTAPINLWSTGCRWSFAERGGVSQIRDRQIHADPSRHGNGGTQAEIERLAAESQEAKR
jgi:hypothetical protein